MHPDADHVLPIASRLAGLLRAALLPALAVIALLIAGHYSAAQAQTSAAARCSAMPVPKGGFLAGGFEPVKFQPMASYCFDRHGLFTVVLADGSIWQQWPDDVRYAYWRRPPQNYQVLMRGNDTNGTLVTENDGLEYRVRKVG